MPAFFETNEHAPGFPDDKHQQIQLAVSALAKVELTKVNASPNLGWTEHYELLPTGSLWPTQREYHGRRDEILATFIRSKPGVEDMTRGDITRELRDNIAFGVTPNVAAGAVTEILNMWSDFDDDEFDEVTRTLGVARRGRGTRVRFMPEPGWEPQLED